MNMKKNRELRSALREMGFSSRRGRGSHEIWVNNAGIKIVLCGKDGHDAKPYQAKRVRKALRQVGGRKSQIGLRACLKNKLLQQRR